MQSEADLKNEVRRGLISSHSDFIDRIEVANAVAGAAPLLESEQFELLVDELMDELHGLGPLEALLADSSVTDILITGSRGVWVERHGKLEQADVVLERDRISHIIERIVAPLGLRVDRSSPIVDARLIDGTRVNVILPPLAVDGPCISIRRFPERNIELERIASGEVGTLLAQAVAAKMNILVIGGTGSGKTTLLNALCAHIDDNERIVTVEDAAELRIPKRHVARLEARPDNSEGVGKVTLRDLVRNALRMRPDRIIVGEVRGSEALDMLQAMNTGHEGSMSTCHASGALEALWRIETMVMMAELGLPLEAIRRQVVSAIDLVVQVARTSVGTRKVISVGEPDLDDGVCSIRMIADESSIVELPNRPARVI